MSECVLPMFASRSFIVSGLMVRSLIHFEFTTDVDQLVNELLNLPSYLIGAIVLSIAYDKSNNLVVPIIAHIFNNLISFTSTFM